MLNSLSFLENYLIQVVKKFGVEKLKNGNQILNVVGFNEAHNSAYDSVDLKISFKIEKCLTLPGL